MSNALETHVAIASLVSLYGALLAKEKARADHFEKMSASLLSEAAKKEAQPKPPSLKEQIGKALLRWDTRSFTVDDANRETFIRFLAWQLGDEAEGPAVVPPKAP
jgi:hypothetical protein